ncbi:uncharacterized protein LOC124141337 [Haliotis rufescens]|uniref:uncharacterized protein LOC124141337 n=1 Tax=Haliotis rufescens TaxID=6454 RepID=UPI00201F8BC2|nr:uncharacterized protein LOC124141337 [Haliotis rufescens]
MGNVPASSDGPTTDARCTVYIWFPNAECVGHGAVELDNGTYISWWTKNGKGLTTLAAGTAERTLQGDIGDEGREADCVLEIPPHIVLDQDAMEDWWGKFKESGLWKLMTNCCWVVKEALVVGGIKKYSNIDGLIINIDNPSDLLFGMSKIPAIDTKTGKPLSNGDGYMKGNVLTYMRLVRPYHVFPLGWFKISSQSR